MIKATCYLKSTSCLQFGKYYVVPTKENEDKYAYEERTWRERGHWDENDMLYIPGAFFKKALEESAKFGGQKIPGRGKSTYTKHFMGGIMVCNSIPLKVSKKQVEGRWVFVPSDGKRGGGSRVLKCFPTVAKWEGSIDVMILDDTITPDVFESVLRGAGIFIGVGVFRPQNGGDHGRFEVKKISFKKA